MQASLFDLFEPENAPKEPGPEKPLKPVKTEVTCKHSESCTGHYQRVTDLNNVPGARWECDKNPDHWAGIYTDGKIFFKTAQAIAWGWQPSIEAWHEYREGVRKRVSFELEAVGR